jgi:dTDP-4-amino-4,6-dideoxygalactose transaminase
VTGVQTCALPISRARNAAHYRARLADAGVAITLDALRAGARGVVPPTEVAGARHAYNQFVVRTNHRDALRAALAERGIGSEVYYPVPMHLQPCFADLGHRHGDFPESEHAAAESLALPIYPELTTAQLDAVVAGLVAFARGTS